MLPTRTAGRKAVNATRPAQMNQLFYGDKLEVLRQRERFPDKSVELIYLDPPFNSKTVFRK